MWRGSRGVLLWRLDLQGDELAVEGLSVEQHCGRCRGAAIHDLLHSHQFACKPRVGKGGRVRDGGMARRRLGDGEWRCWWGVRGEVGGVRRGRGEGEVRQAGEEESMGGNPTNQSCSSRTGSRVHAEVNVPKRPGANQLPPLPQNRLCRALHAEGRLSRL